MFSVSLAGQIRMFKIFVLSYEKSAWEILAWKYMWYTSHTLSELDIKSNNFLK